MTNSNPIVLTPEPLTQAAFSPFGDVISDEGDLGDAMNGQAFDRYLDLATIDVGQELEHRVQVNIVKCNIPDASPHMFRVLERHPHSSQLFFPLFNHPYMVVVAPADENIQVQDIKLFLASHKQGINYRRGTWHMPMVGIEKGDRFLMVERSNMASNCDLYQFDQLQLSIELSTCLEVS